MKKRKTELKTGDDAYREMCRRHENIVPETRASMGRSPDVVRHKTRIHEEQAELNRRPFSEKSKALSRKGVRTTEVRRETHAAVITTRMAEFIEPIEIPASHVALIRDLAKKSRWPWTTNDVLKGYESRRLLEAIQTPFEDEAAEASRQKFVDFLRKGKGISVRLRPISEQRGRLGA